MAVQRLLHVVSLQPFSAVSYTFIAMFKVQKFNLNLIKNGNLPLLGSPNNTQFYGTGKAGSVIGNLMTQGVKTTARLWTAGKQTRLNSRNGQFNIF